MSAGRRSAALSLCLAAIGAAVAAASTLLAHQGRMQPITGLTLSTTGLILGGFLAIVAGFVAFLRGATGPSRRNAIAGALLGTLLLLIPATLGARASRLPPIHDLTTDIGDPPTFVHASTLPANRDRSLAYPHGLPDTPERQAEAYADLAPVLVPAPPAEAWHAALDAAKALGWQVSWEDPTGGRFEAVDTSSLFRLVDDIAVRVRAGENGAIVDVRSVSREGASDFGRNARRIRAFIEELRARTSA